MLHDAKFAYDEKGSAKHFATLFIPTVILKDLDLNKAVLKVSAIPGGTNPGPDTEISVEVTLPKK